MAVAYSFIDFDPATDHGCRAWGNAEILASEEVIGREDTPLQDHHWTD